MSRFFGYLILATLSGCTTQPSVISIGEGVYMITRSNSINFPNPENPNAQAMRIASKHCKLQQKFLGILSIEETKPPYTAEHTHRVTTQFKCT
jgi:hypothetical protein